MNKYGVSIFFATLALFSIATQGAENTVKIAKANGAKQCESGHITSAAMRAELTSKGVEVVSAACGNDGLMHAAVCGAESGEINIFEISSGDLDKARNLGFMLLSHWPDAQEVACRDQELSSSQALDISIFSIGPPVDAKAYKKVRLVIGNAIASGVLDKFIVRGYGIEGGFSGCVESGRFTPEKRFNNVLKQLRAIRPNRETTAYSVEPTASCTL